MVRISCYRNGIAWLYGIFTRCHSVISENNTWQSVNGKHIGCDVSHVHFEATMLNVWNMSAFHETHSTNPPKNQRDRMIAGCLWRKCYVYLTRVCIITLTYFHPKLWLLTLLLGGDDLKGWLSLLDFGFFFFVWDHSHSLALQQLISARWWVVCLRIIILIQSRAAANQIQLAMKLALH